MRWTDGTWGDEFVWCAEVELNDRVSCSGWRDEGLCGRRWGLRSAPHLRQLLRELIELGDGEGATFTGADRLQLVQSDAHGRISNPTVVARSCLEQPVTSTFNKSPLSQKVVTGRTLVRRREPSKTP